MLPGYILGQKATFFRMYPEISEARENRILYDCIKRTRKMTNGFICNVKGHLVRSLGPGAEEYWYGFCETCHVSLRWKSSAGKPSPGWQIMRPDLKWVTIVVDDSVIEMKY